MGSSTLASAKEVVEEVVRREVPDWDDELASMARFKAFSGQRSDWEPRFLFWRDIILKVARRLGVFFVSSSEVKSTWFSRRGLTPLCIDRVLQEMHNNGDIFLRGDLMDPTSGRLYWMLRRVGYKIGISKSVGIQQNLEDSLILRPLLYERCADFIKTLSEDHWTSTCVLTMSKFRGFFKGSDEAFIVLSHLCECGKARYFSIRKSDFIEGVKISLVSDSVAGISSLDWDVLHLTWTTEKFQQQLDVVDQRWQNSRKLAVASLKMGDKQAAYRYIRQGKLFSKSRGKCASLLERVEEVLGVIANAESTKKVSEAIQIGSRAMKENRISLDEIHLHLQELNESVASQKEVDQALGSVPLQYVEIEDEDLEEEFKKLEEDLADETPQSQTPEPAVQPVPAEASTQKAAEESLSNTFSNLNLEAA